MSSDPSDPDGPPADVPSDDIHATEDATLRGYFDTHDRPPAFEGTDGHPYTVSIEVEKTPDLAAPFKGFLVFPRWAKTGVGIVGHVETPILCEGRSKEAVLEEVGAYPLLRVKRLLDEAVAASASP